MGVWWTAWVLDTIIQYSPLQVVLGRWKLKELAEHFNPVGLDAFLGFFRGRVVSNCVGIAASLLTVVVVVSITKLQQRRRSEIDALVAR